MDATPEIPALGQEDDAVQLAALGQEDDAVQLDVNHDDLFAKLTQGM